MNPKPSRKGCKKSTNAEAAEIRETVFGLVLAGFREAQIRQNLAKQGHPLSKRQTDRYMAEAVRRFRALSEANMEAERGKALGRLDDLYAKAVAMSDHNCALNVQRERNKLLGLHAPAKVETHVTADAGPCLADVLETMPLSVIDALAQARHP